MKVKNYLLLMVWTLFILPHYTLASEPVIHASIPLLVKTNYPGYVLPEKAIQETCSIFFNKTIIHISYGYGSLESKQLLRHGLGLSVFDLLKKVQDEPLIKEPNYLCDAPSSTIIAYDQEEPVLLHNTGGCGTPSQERVGPNSTILINMVNQICP